MHSTDTIPYEEATLNMLYVTKTIARTDADILKDNVTVAKDKRGARGSIVYGIHYGLSTNELYIKFGLPRHFHPTVRDD